MADANLASILAIASTSHLRTVTIEALDAARNPIADVPLAAYGGSVTMNRAQCGVRRTLTLTIEQAHTSGLLDQAGRFDPTAAGDALFAAKYLRVSRGVGQASPGSSVEAVLGTFHCDEPVLTMTPDGATIAIRGTDRMGGLVGMKTSAPLAFAAGSAIDAAVRAILVDAGLVAVGEGPFYAAGNLTAARRIEQGSDVLQVLSALVADYALELYADAAGTIVLDARQHLLLAPVANLGDTGLVATQIERGLVAAEMVETVTVIGTASDLAAPVVATQTNPSLPAGLPARSIEVRSPGIRTVAQAQAAADALMREYSGYGEHPRVSLIPVPGIEPGDAVNCASTPLYLDDDPVSNPWIVETLSMPLAEGDAAAELRRYRTAAF